VDEDSLAISENLLVNLQHLGLFQQPNLHLESGIRERREGDVVGFSKVIWGVS